MKTMHPLGNTFRVAHGPIPNILLRKARKRNRWTQKELAEKLSVTPLSVGRWERGEVVPNNYGRYMLCALFNKSAQELGLSDFNDETATPDVVLNENYPSWHHNLKRERQLRGWSQTNVAAHIGSDTKTVGRWERGLAFPSPYFQQKLINLFGKDAEALGFIAGQGETHTGPFHSQSK